MSRWNLEHPATCGCSQCRYAEDMHNLTALRCVDCGLLYSDDGWCDCVVPNDVWTRISPTGHEGGLLCLHCMARRLVRAGLNDVPVKITSGPFVNDEVAR